MRCDPDTHEPSRFSTFCPKAIALKGKKMPDTMLSRTIFIEMKRRLRSEKVEHFRHLDDAGFARMRSQLARWAADNGVGLGLAQPVQPEGFINRTASNWELMFAIADSLGEKAGQRARRVAQHIVGSVDMSSAGVELLRDIKAMFDASTLDYLTTKHIIENLTADPEKPWAEWSRGRPINDKGLADLLRGHSIYSRTVGPKETRSKGYRKADFEDARERYLTPEKREARPNPDILPFTRSLHCNHSTFAESSPVHQEVGERQKIGHFSNETNAVNGRTGERGETDAFSGDGPPADAVLTETSPPHTLQPKPAADKAGPGLFLDADGKPTDDPEDGYYGRVERQQVEDAYKADLQVNPRAPAAKSVPVSYGPGLPRKYGTGVPRKYGTGVPRKYGAPRPPETPG
jgi:hypothetical protein